MTCNEAGVSLIKEHEGLRLSTYRCSAGHLTIGWGHTGPDVKPGMTISRERAEELFCQDLARAESLAMAHLTQPLSENAFSAFVSILFNVGPGSKDKDGIIRLRSGNPSSLLRKINSGDMKGAAEEFPHWCHSNGEIEIGLLKRREAERELFLS